MKRAKAAKVLDAAVVGKRSKTGRLTGMVRRPLWAAGFLFGFSIKDRRSYPRFRHAAGSRGSGDFRPGSWYGLNRLLPLMPEN